MSTLKNRSIKVSFLKIPLLNGQKYFIGVILEIIIFLFEFKYIKMYFPFIQNESEQNIMHVKIEEPQFSQGIEKIKKRNI